MLIKAAVFRTILIILIATAVILVIGMFYKAPPKNVADGKLRVAATIHPLADMIGQVGGQYVTVQTILPAGASPHTFESTPEQIRSLQGTKLIFSIGQGLDNWVGPIVENVPGATNLRADRGIKFRQLPVDQIDPDTPNQTVDPHYWLDVSNAKIMCQNIASELSSVDPAHKAEYEKNLAEYLVKLDALDREIRDQLSKVSQKEMITHHNAWGYFADAYGLKIAGTFEISPGKEPTPKQIADLQNLVKQYGVKTIFSEPQLSEQRLIPFTQDLKLKTAMLDPEGGYLNMGYIDMMRYNANVIVNALK
ncbi:MAG: metal ABC transporter substrate-binding protein [Patescibacteria group bacterium]|nr:metal ABC transporter substrate-binding protein [Patescibacteria group bacterium]